MLLLLLLNGTIVIPCMISVFFFGLIHTTTKLQYDCNPT